MTKKGITSNRRDAFEARGAMRRFGVLEVGEARVPDREILRDTPPFGPSQTGMKIAWIEDADMFHDCLGR